MCYRTIPQLISWGDQKLAVKLDVKRSKCYTGVAQRKRAVKHRLLPFLPLVVRFEDGYGLQPRGRRIETYHRYSLFFNEVFISLKKNVLTFSCVHCAHVISAHSARLLDFDALCLLVPSSNLFTRLDVVHDSFRGSQVLHSVVLHLFHFHFFVFFVTCCRHFTFQFHQRFC